jgi:hypothetical protein
MTLTAQADRMLTAPAGAKPIELGVDISITSSTDKTEILVGDVTKVPNPNSGRDMLAMAPLAVPVPMKEYTTFTATRSLSMPKGWIVPKNNVPRLAAAIDRLRWHGVKIQEMTDDAQLAVERFSITNVTRQQRAFQGHNEARATGAYDNAQLSVQAGSLFIPANQPLGRLAFYLIEPESDDGLVAWNLIDEAPAQTYPIYRVTGSAPLRLK